MGYYGGNGARKVATVPPSATLPQTQPACLTDAATGLIDCGNWASLGVLGRARRRRLGHLLRQARPRPTGPAAPATSSSSSATTPATPTCCSRPPTRPGRPTTSYGGNSLYVGTGPGAAAPTRSATTGRSHPRRPTTEDCVFNAEYPMVRWLEANGYDVSYITGVDTDRRGRADPATTRSSCRSGTTSTGRASSAPTSRRPATPASTWPSSAATRSSGRPAGRTASTARGTPYRTLVSYKETHANAKIDPLDPTTWTGTWRDPRFSPPADGGRPENALTGTIFTVNGRTDGDPGAGRRRQDAVLAQHRASRPSAAGADRDARRRARSATSGTRTLDNGSRPAGLIDLSIDDRRRRRSVLQDYGITYGAGHRDPPPDPVPRAERRAGLRRRHRAVVLGPGRQPRPRRLGDAGRRAMQQATVNLLRRHGRPARRPCRPGLVAATAVHRHDRARRSTITSPAAGATRAGGHADHRHRHRQPTPAAGSSAGSRSRSTAARPGTRRSGRATLDATRWTPSARRHRHDQGPRRRRQRANLGTAGDRRHVDRRTAAAARAPSGQLGRPAAPPTGRRHAGRGRRQVPAPTPTATSPASASTRAPATPAPTSAPLDRDRHAAGHGDLHRRDATGWQQVDLRHARCRSPPARPTSRPTTRRTATTRPTTATSPPPASTRRRCTRSRTAPTAPTASTVRASAASRPRPSASTNYWVDVVFTAGRRRPTPPRRRSRPRRPTGATGVATAATVDGDVQRGRAVGHDRDQPHGRGRAPRSPAPPSYDSATRTATFTPAARARRPATTYTATVSGAKDAAGNTMAPRRPGPSPRPARRHDAADGDRHDARDRRDRGRHRHDGRRATFSEPVQAGNDRVQPARRGRHARSPATAATTRPTQTATFTPSAALAAAPPTPRRSRGAQDTAATPWRPRRPGRSPPRPAVRTCPCTIWTAATPGEPRDADTGGRRGRREVPLRRRRQRHRRPVLQGHRQHRHPRRAPVVGTGHAAGARRTFPVRRPPAGSRSRSPRPVAITADTTYVASYYAPNGHYADDNGVLRQRPSTTARCTRSPDGAERRQRRLPLRRRRRLPDRQLPERATTGSTSVFTAA